MASRQALNIFPSKSTTRELRENCAAWHLLVINMRRDGLLKCCARFFFSHLTRTQFYVLYLAGQYGSYAQVTRLLAELRMDKDSLIAGLLHDTVEDQPGQVTFEEIGVSSCATIIKKNNNKIKYNNNYLSGIFPMNKVRRILSSAGHYRRTSISGTTFSGKKCLKRDNFPCYLTT
jgi:hypothetical protein